MKKQLLITGILAAIAGYWLAKEKYHTLTINSDEGGDVVAGFGNTATGSQKVKPGTTHVVVATPSSGYEFVGWRNIFDIIESTQANYSFVMPNRDVNLTAVFKIREYNVNVNTEIEGSPIK